MPLSRRITRFECIRSWSLGILLCVAPGAHAQVAAFSARPNVVRAGGLYEVAYTFDVGAPGFSKGGGVRIEIPVAYAETEFLLWSAPQIDRPDAPGYVRATTSNNAPTTVRIEGLLRGIVQADFDAPVPTGATITIHYRGQVQAIAGQIDARYASRVKGGDNWSVAPSPPRITIRPDRAQLVQVHYASDLERNIPFAMSLVALDRYGNLASGFSGALSLRSTDANAVFPRTIMFRPADSGRVVVPIVVFRTVGFQKITATDPTKTVRTGFKYALVSDRLPTVRHLFGDTHFHTGTGAANRGFFTSSSGADVNTTGTNTFKELNLAGDHRANFTRASAAYTYARDVMGLDFANTAEHASPLLTPNAWRASQDVADSFNTPGEFTTFYGFEWTPDLNHYVVLYKSRDGKPFGHDSFPDYASLSRALDAQGVSVLTIPHVSWPFANHNIWQDTIRNEYRRVGEIYSLWNSRHLVQPDDEPELFELGDDNVWSYQYAWKKGFRLGVLASTDNHLGHPGANNIGVSVRHSGGLAAVLTATNERELLWRSLTDRATYATTGTQIYLDFASDGHPMGSEYRSSAPPHFTGRVAGTNTLASVEIVRLAGGRYSTAFTAKPNAETYALDFVDRDFVGPAMYYLRVKQVDEYPDRLYAHSTAEMAWSSPIWIDR
jgi:hypothetical protein